MGKLARNCSRLVLVLPGQVGKGGGACFSPPSDCLRSRWCLCFSSPLRPRSLADVTQRDAKASWATGNPSRDFLTLCEDSLKVGGGGSTFDSMSSCPFVFRHLGVNSACLLSSVRPGGTGNFSFPELPSGAAQLASAHVSTTGGGWLAGRRRRLRK